MTTEEFSNEFDVLLNSFSPLTSSGGMLTSIGLNEYEKSVYLTQAQEAIVLSLYNGKNPFGESFEQTEELRRYLDVLERGESLTPVSGYDAMNASNAISKHGAIFLLPKDVWFITHEYVNYGNTNVSEECRDTLNEVAVVPVTQDEYNRIKKNPFRGANIRRALRLDIGKPSNYKSDGTIVQIISPTDMAILSYHINYISKPSPIILVDLPDNINIEGSNKAQTCLLNEALHRTILQKAIQIAIANRIQGSKKED